MKNRIYTIIILLLLQLSVLAEDKNKDWILFNLNFNEFPEIQYLSLEVVDIDFDGDADLFLGTGNGTIFFYENTGTPEKYLFTLKKQIADRKKTFLNIKTENKIIPRFVDIDGDNDLDLFFGNNDGNIGFYQNEGNINKANFVKVKGGRNKKDSYFNINVGLSSAPYFVDIDNDGDYDLFIGNANGYIAFYRNEGSVNSPLFVRIFGGFVKKDSYHQIDVGEYSIPFFTDINFDDKYDLFIGNFNGTICYYKNIGTVNIPEFDLVTENFASIEVGGDASPCFVDIDNNGKDEILVGNYEGKIFSFRHYSGREIVQLSELHLYKHKQKKKKLSKKEKRINEDEILLKKARQLVLKKEHIEAANVLNKIDETTKESKDLKNQCKQKIKELYNKMENESFLFREVKRNFKNAVNYYIKGKYGKSKKQFEKVLSSVPNHKVSIIYKKRTIGKIEAGKREKEAENFYSNALYQYKKGNFKDAFYFAKKALDINKDNAEYYERYTKYSNEYFSKEGEILYETGISKAKNLIKQKKYISAAKILMHMKEKFPADTEIEELIQVCSKKSAIIKKQYNKQIGEKYLKKADEYYEKKDFKSALKYYKLAENYSKVKKPIRAKIKLARSLLRKKQQRRLNPRAVKKYFQNGLRFYTLGQYEKAIQEWKRVLEIDPKHLMAKKNIEKAKKMIGK